MSIGHTFLGLLKSGRLHGYDLKRAFDERFGQDRIDRPLTYGQVYATLARLLPPDRNPATGQRSPIVAAIPNRLDAEYRNRLRVPNGAPLSD